VSKVQNRYTADLGDFGKYGLLRALCFPANSDETRFKLGVIWYLVEDESHNEDGKYIRYLEPTNKNIIQYRNCDPQLYDALSVVQANSRSVAAIQDSDILPSDTIYYDNILDFNSLPTGTPEAILRRKQRRTEWLNAGSSNMQDCDVIFFDPDNGLEVKSVAAHQNKGVKYLFFNELNSFSARGQNLIIYHHICRNGTATEQVQQRFTQLKNHLPSTYEIFAMLYKRGTLRAFFIAGNRQQAPILLKRTQLMLDKSGWIRHFDLHLPNH